jgi:hypothetical protein
MTDKIYLHTFAVVGRGEFPLDMLRSDRCFPCSSGDADRMHYDNRDHRVIRLEAASRNKHWMPTHGRWASFGWTALDDTTEAMEQAWAKIRAQAEEAKLQASFREINQ